jgi:hypothetical protein
VTEHYERTLALLDVVHLDAVGRDFAMFLFGHGLVLSHISSVSHWLEQGLWF